METSIGRASPLKERMGVIIKKTSVRMLDGRRFLKHCLLILIKIHKQQVVFRAPIPDRGPLNHKHR